MTLHVTPARRARRALSIRNIIVSAVAGLWLGVGGCASKPLDKVDGGAPIAPPVATTQPADTPDHGSADALKLKTENWARDMEAAMKARGRRPIGSTEPSVADSIRPEELNIGIGGSLPPKRPEPEIMTAPISKPVVESTQSSANQIASTAGSRSVVPPASGSAASPNNATTLLGDSESSRRPETPRASGQPPVRGDDALGASLAKMARENPKDLSAQADHQFLEFLKDRPVPQMDQLSRLSPEDREHLLVVLDGLTNWRNAIRADSNMLPSRKVRPLLEMADRLKALADLTIPTVALCTRVDGFGVYDSIEPARFTAMRERPVIIYCEVGNFSSHMNEKRLWETKLSQEVVLYTETGLPVWQDRTENIPDLARRRRQDFFIVKKTRFPANITIGRYLLKVTVVDQQANRVAEATLPVQFVAGQ